MRTLFALCSVLAFSGCAIIVTSEGGEGHIETMWANSAVQGNGEIISEKRPVTELHSLNINGAVQVEVRVGQAASLEIIGDSNLLPLIHTETVSSAAVSKLLPSPAPSSDDVQKIWVDQRFASSQPIRVIYTVAKLDKLVANGSGRLSINGLNGSSLDLQKSGSRTVQLEGKVSDLRITSSGSGAINASALESKTASVSMNGSGALSMGPVQGESVKLEMNGSGALNVIGKVQNLNVSVNGSGSANLSSLLSQSAQLNTNGSGHITAAVAQNVVVLANGSGYVTVYGNPAQRNVNGKHVNFVN